MENSEGETEEDRGLTKCLKGKITLLLSLFNYISVPWQNKDCAKCVSV